MLRRATVGLVFLSIGILVGWITREQAWRGLIAQTPITAQPPITTAPSPRFSLPSDPVYLPPRDRDNAIGPSTMDNLTPEERINVGVYEACNRGVVNISTKSVRPDRFLSLSSVEGSGSGSILDRSGNVLTNYHVIEGARDISVTLFNNESYAAELLGADPDNDVAILKINAPADSLIPIPLGDSSHIRVGQRILAIGNPFGLERTMSDGIVSSLNRQLPSRNRRTMKSIIQIDAALNQGNSGGPLLNTRGELIGMNTAIATSTGDNAGIGFAIPVNTIRRLVPQLIQFGKVTRPTIGITRVYEKAGQGLQVVTVTPNGPAEQAGIQGFKIVRRPVRRAGITFEQESVDPYSADLIVGVDGVRIATSDDLIEAIEKKKAGDQVVLTVIRSGKQLSVAVTLGESD